MTVAIDREKLRGAIRSSNSLALFSGGRVQVEFAKSAAWAAGVSAVKRV